MTKKYRVENFDQVARERDMFMIAMNDQLNGAVCWSRWINDPYSEGKYRVGVCRLEAADGGLVLITFRHPRQMDYTTVYMADGFDGLNPAICQAYYDARTSYRAESVCTAADGHVKTITASNGDMRLVNADELAMNFDVPARDIIGTACAEMGISENTWRTMESYRIASEHEVAA